MNKKQIMFMEQWDKMHLDTDVVRKHYDKDRVVDFEVLKQQLFNWLNNDTKNTYKKNWKRFIINSINREIARSNHDRSKQSVFGGSEIIDKLREQKERETEKLKERVACRK